MRDERDERDERVLKRGFEVVKMFCEIILNEFPKKDLRMTQF